MEVHDRVFYKTNHIYKIGEDVVCFQVNQHDVYEKEDLVKGFDLIAGVAEEQPFLYLLDIGNYDFLMTKEARNFFHEYEKPFKLIKAQAVVITSSTSTRIMYNLVAKIYPPKFPFKAFSSRQKALNWLRTHDNV